MIRLVPGVVVFLLWVFCVVDVVGTAERRVRHLSKLVWLLLVLLFPLVGSIAWLVAGRPQRSAPLSRAQGAAGFPEYDRPGRMAATDPAADEDFLRQVRARAEEQRRRYDAERRRRAGEEPQPGPDEQA